MLSDNNLMGYGRLTDAMECAGGGILWLMNVNILENSERIFLKFVFAVPSHLPAHPSVRKAHIEEERHNFL